VEPLQSTVNLDCDGPVGFAGVTQTNMACAFTPQTGTRTVAKPVIITVKGMATAIGAGTSNSLRIVKFTNPTTSDSTVKSTKLWVHVITRIWSSELGSKYKIYESKDYRVFLRDNTNTFYGSGTTAIASTAVMAAATTYTDVSGALTLRMDATAAISVDLQPTNNGVLIIIFDPAWSFLATGDTAMSCS
jgi:hypothetical protein